jgi:hypothetical protein
MPLLLRWANRAFSEASYAGMSRNPNFVAIFKNTEVKLSNA